MPDNNNIVYKARLHWILFFWPLGFLIGAIITGFYVEQLAPLAGILSIFSIFWLIAVFVSYQTSYLIIKEKQVILQTGIFVRQTLDIPLHKIESIDIRQPIIGVLFQYGTLLITGTGGSQQRVNYISRPLTCRRYIEQLMY